MITQVGNKLIAEFMGCEEKTCKGVHSPITYWSGIPDDNGKSFPKIYDLKYHESWDWLMPVVEKLEEIYNVEIKDNLVIIYPKENDWEEIYEGEDKLNAVWGACVNLIQWFNKTKRRDSTKECKESNPLKCGYPHCTCMAMMHKPRPE